MRITVASYNIHKAVGLDRRRDPERILAILREVDADVIALQECDRRFGERPSVIPRVLLDDSPWCAVPVKSGPLGGRPNSLGWHGNAILVRKGIEVLGCSPVPLPMLEPRGAVCADLVIAGKPLRIIGMHLDISGLRRHHQVRSVVGHATRTPSPTVLMGDLNDWSRNGRALREFGPSEGGGWSMVRMGDSFPARRPVAPLDRIIVSHDLVVAACGVHRSALASVGSDHLPVWATLTL